MRKLIVLLALLACCGAGWGSKTLMDLVRNKHDALINEFRHRCYKDFVLVVEWEEEVVFRTSYLVHPLDTPHNLGKNNWPKNVDRKNISYIYIDKYGLKDIEE